MADKDRLVDKVRRSALIRVGIQTYRQIAALTGTLSMLVLLHHMFNLDIRGLLGEIVEYWDQYVRPIMKWATDILIVVPLRLLGISIELPVNFRDWLTVGVILCASYVRAFRSYWNLGTESRVVLALNVVMVVLGGPLWIFVLPLAAGLLLLAAWTWQEAKDLLRRLYYALAPTVYLGLLLGLNALFGR
jgi:hypothetical protein